MRLRIVVLPALGGETISPRCPLPIGDTRSIRRWVRCARLGLQNELLAREDRRQGVEVRALSGDVRDLAVDRLDAQQPEVLLGLLRRPDLAGDPVAGPQTEPPDLRLRDVDVGLAGQQRSCAQEAEALVDDLEHAAGEDVPLALGLGLKDAEHSSLCFRPAASVTPSVSAMPSSSLRLRSSRAARVRSPPNSSSAATASSVGPSRWPSGASRTRRRAGLRRSALPAEDGMTGRSDSVTHSSRDTACEVEEMYPGAVGRYGAGEHTSKLGQG